MKPPRAALSVMLPAWAALACAPTVAPTLPAAPRALASAPDAGGKAEPEGASAPGCAPATDAAPPAFRWPARGGVTSGFGMRGGRHHGGIDISSAGGLAVRAAAAGTVEQSGHRGSYGRMIVLSHPGGYQTVYAHNQDNFVGRGDRVEQGQVIADMGSTGHASAPHLHFEIRRDGRRIDPVPCLPAASD